MDEETVGNILLMDSIFVGDGSIPHTPLSGRNPSRTPGIKCNEALFNSLVYNMVPEPIGRKEGLGEAICISYDHSCPRSPEMNRDAHSVVT
jgi:hypothetical protein